MATKLFLRSSLDTAKEGSPPAASSSDPTVTLASLDSTGNSGSTTAHVMNTIAGPVTPPTTATQWTTAAGSNKFLWISQPLQSAVTFSASNQLTFNLWAFESAAQANATITAEFLRMSGDGNTSLGVIAAVLASRAELTTSATLQNWAVTQSAVTVNAGERLGVRCYIDDGNGVTMASGRTCTLDIEGTILGSDGDSWISIVDAVTFSLPVTKALSDNNGANWSDAVTTQLVVVQRETLSDTVTLSDATAKVLSFEKALTDTLTMSDSVATLLGIAFTFQDFMDLNDVAGSLAGGEDINPNGFALWRDNFYQVFGANNGTAVEILNLRDGFQRLKVTGVTSGLSVGVSTDIEFWVEQVLNLPPQLGDMMGTLADSLKIGLGIALADNEGPNWADPSLSLIGQWQVQLACPHLNNWLDALSSQLASPVLTEVLTDSWGTSTTDNFNRANENPLSGGGNWSTAGNPLALQVLSNVCTISATHTICVEEYLGTVFPADQYAEVAITAIGASGTTCEQGPCVRTQSGAADSRYGLVVQAGAFGTARTLFIGRYISGAETTVASGSFTVNVNDVFRISANGTTITAYQNGTQILQGSDTTWSNGAPGLYGFSSNAVADVGMDNFAAGGVVAWSDAFSYQLLSGTLSENLSDTLTMSDSLIAGYGNALVESLTFVDSTSVGFGDLIADSMTLTDSEVTVLGINELFADTLSMSDSDSIGYGNALTDSLTLSDSLLIGYGLLISEQLVLSDFAALGFGNIFSDTIVITDSTAVGYGVLFADSMTLTDSAIEVLGIVEKLSDTLTMSDSLAVGYGNAISDQLVLSDFAALGFGNIISDTIVITDTTSIGYGLLMSDQMVLSDSMTALMAIAGTFSDTIVFSDSMLLGYGDQITDSLTLTDSATLVLGLNESVTETLSISDSMSLGYGLAITDALTMTDSLASLLSIAETLSDTLTFSDSLTIGYGDQISEQMVLADFTALGYGSATSDTIVFSDSTAIGYGLLTADQMVLSDSAVEVLGLVENLSDTLTLSDAITGLGYGNALTDTLTFTDSAAIGYGNSTSDTIVFTDSNLIGYGLLFADQMTLTDSAIAQLQGGNEIDEVLSDTLVFSDSSKLGYGLLISDQVVLSDTLAIGYGLLVSDQNVLSDSMSLGYGNSLSDTLALTDSERNVLGMNELLSDTLSMSDSALIGYGNVITDTIVLSDTLAIGYGLLTSDALTIADSCAVGYGNKVSDQLTLTDSVIEQLGIAEMLSDTMTAADAITGIGYGNSITDQLTLTDSLAISYGLQISDAIVISDFTGIGYGDILADNLNNWLDAIVVSTGQPVIQLNLSDTAAMSDSLAAGYGCQVSEVVVMNDSTSMRESFEVLIAEASGPMLDAMSALMTFALQVNDALLIQEQILTTYGLLTSDSFFLQDSLDESLQAVLALAVSDSAEADWLDEILVRLVFAPGAMVIQYLTVLAEVVAAEIFVRGQQEAFTVENQGQASVSEANVSPQQNAEHVVAETQDGETTVEVL